MGNTVLAFLLVLFVVIFTGVNSFFVCEICDRLIYLIQTEDYAELEAFWEEKRPYLSMFIRDAEIDSAEAEIKNLNIAIAFEDGEAETAKTSLIDAINELKNFEKLSAENLF